MGYSVAEDWRLQVGEGAYPYGGWVDKKCVFEGAEVNEARKCILTFYIYRGLGTRMLLRNRFMILILCLTLSSYLKPVLRPKVNGHIEEPRLK